MNAGDFRIFDVMILRRIRKVLPIGRFRQPPPRVAVLRLEGVIMASASRLRRGQLNLSALDRTLERAFALPDLAAVAITVNSPGGSPVQSSLVAGRIRALADERKLPVLTFVEDVAASGGYWIACAGDEIYADASSIVGSIGVVFAGFGFAELIARHGIERRLHTAGASKGALDPFLPEVPDDVARLAESQAAIHDAFKDWIRTRRGARLSGPEDELFSGAFWTGRKALGFGLVDGIGDLRTILRERYGRRTQLIPVGRRRSLLSLAPGMGSASDGGYASVAHSLAAGALTAVEERLLWSRFGL